MDFDKQQLDEREQWLRAICFARAYVKLREFELSNVSAGDARAYIRGKITLYELLKRSTPSSCTHRLLKDLYTKA